MGATAAIAVGGIGYLAQRSGAKRQKDSVNQATQDALQSNAALTPVKLPDPPNQLDAANKAGKAMSDAVRRARRQSGGGLASTTSMGAAGDPSTAPTFRKQLLGR